MDNENYLDIILISIGKPILFLFPAVRMTDCYILIIAIIPKNIGKITDFHCVVDTGPCGLRIVSYTKSHGSDLT